MSVDKSSQCIRRLTGSLFGPVKFSICVLYVLCGFNFSARAGDSEKPDPDPARWEKAIQKFERWDSKNSAATDAVLFVGSSSIVGWKTHELFPDLPVINRGFGGSQTSDVNHYVDKVVAPYKPRAIVLYAGDNDIADGKSPEQVADDYREFVRLARRATPDVPIVYVAIKPSRARWTLWPKMKATNELIEEFTRTDQRQFFADIAPPMLGEDGKPRAELLLDDGLHLTAEGFREWTNVVRASVDQALQNHASPTRGTDKPVSTVTDPLVDGGTPIVALWRFSPNSALRYAVWSDGRTIFASDSDRWDCGLRLSRLSDATMKRLKRKINETGVFELKGHCYLVPDAPVYCLMLSFAGKQQMLYWDEREIAGYGINIAPQPRHLAFKRAWKETNEIVLSQIPTSAQKYSARFTAPPADWYLKEMIQSE